MRFLLPFILCLNLSAANWYWDKDASGANNGTSWTDAWTTPPSISSMGVGDTLYISGGSTSKTYTNQWVIAADSKFNSDANRLTVRVGQDASHNGIVVFEGGNTFSNAWYFTGGVKYLNVNGQGSAGGTNLVFQNYYHAAATSTHGSAIVSLSTDNHIDIGFITVSNCNNGVTLNGSTYNVVHDSQFLQIKGDHAITFGARTPEATSYSENNVAARNTIEVIWDSSASYFGPDGISGQSGNTAYSNVIYGVSGTIIGSQHPDAFQLSGDFVKIFANDVRDMGNSMVYVDQGIRDPALWNDYQVFNNVMRLTNPQLTNSYTRGVGLRAHDTCYAISNVWILNNTFVDLPRFTAIELWASTNSGWVWTNIYIANNLIHNVGMNSSEPAIFMRTDGVPAGNLLTNGWFVDYNVVSPGSAYGKVNIGNAEYTQPHGATTQPSFTSYTAINSGNDFRLLSSDTVAKDAGMDWSSILSVDADGVSRPQNSLWDIGAYEYDAGTPPDPDPPATGGGTITINTLIIGG